MQYNVSQLLKEPTGDTRKYEVQEESPVLDSSLVLRAPLSGQVKMVRTAHGILVTGSLHTAAEVECARCLDVKVVPVDFAVEEEFHPTVDVLTGVPLFLADEGDPATLIDAQHILDLTELVRQDALLNLPLYPVCRPNCRGLCPVCGENLNDNPDHHHEEPVDLELSIPRK